MTGRLRFGKMSIGKRVSARIEHKATPITRTMTEMGLRRALRRSHIAISLLAYCFAAIREMAPGRLALLRPKRGSARSPAARGRHRFLLAPESSARLKHRRGSQGPPDNAHVPGFQSCERLR